MPTGRFSNVEFELFLFHCVLSGWEVPLFDVEMATVYRGLHVAY